MTKILCLIALLIPIFSISSESRAATGDRTWESGISVAQYEHLYHRFHLGISGRMMPNSTFAGFFGYLHSDEWSEVNSETGKSTYRPVTDYGIEFRYSWVFVGSKAFRPRTSVEIGRMEYSDDRFRRYTGNNFTSVGLGIGIDAWKFEPYIGFGWRTSFFPNFDRRLKITGKYVNRTLLFPKIELSLKI